MMISRVAEKNIEIFMTGQENEIYFIYEILSTRCTALWHAKKIWEWEAINWFIADEWLMGSNEDTSWAYEAFNCINGKEINTLFLVLDFILYWHQLLIDIKGLKIKFMQIELQIVHPYI